MLRVLLALLVLGGAAAAQDTYPRLHDVVGVAPDDVLNLRAGPGAGHDKVGELAFDARGIEVVRAEGNWGLVNAGEGPGWASLRYLSPRADGDLPNVRRVTCGGTEPFWDVEVFAGQDATIRTPMNYETGDRFSVGLFQRAYNPLEKYVLQGTNGSRDLALVVAGAYCDNGMSDNEFGLDATLIVTGPDGYVYSGCCELSE
ncbi:peptide-binding protein [Mameliella sp. AT18]|uniref:hypothetical protein n=1 Tax=Mameliella sp. AT18 TaxID=3028385 RepID=UPI0008411879|nr:hypothetical protein [Mameliella sp. AT18]MDD9729939.1 peptide-binding protein [Mameliella sp. AT18]ODM46924.1 hypothetical protein A9320_05835 [Ruegeria sp. PBVC088]